jgi:hypothetical protein
LKFYNLCSAIKKIELNDKNKKEEKKTTGGKKSGAKN